MPEQRRESRPVSRAAITKNAGGVVEKHSTQGTDNRTVVRVVVSVEFVTEGEHVDLEHRCRRCRSRLTAPKSVAAELGPVCRRAEAVAR
mgnify:CR=1 FL=1